MLTDTVKFSALGVKRAHLQDVVQVDFARALESQYKTLERDAHAALGALNAGHVERAAEILRIALGAEVHQQSSGQSEPTNPPPAAGHSEEGGA